MSENSGVGLHKFHCIYKQTTEILHRLPSTVGIVVYYFTILYILMSVPCVVSILSVLKR
jgi:hypothetical protein